MELKQGTLESHPHLPADTYQLYQIRSTHSSSGMNSKQGAWMMLKQFEPSSLEQVGPTSRELPFFVFSEQSFFSLPHTRLSACLPYLHDSPGAQRDSQLLLGLAQAAKRTPHSLFLEQSRD